MASRPAGGIAFDRTIGQLGAMYRIGLYCLTILGLNGCEIDPLCSSQVLQVARDTGSDRYAVTVLRDCGATTDYATVVKVGRAGEWQSAARDVFVADRGSAHSFAGNAIWTSVVWTRPGQLSVAYATRARVFRREATAKGASIRYLESDPIGVPPPG